MTVLSDYCQVTKSDCVITYVEDFLCSLFGITILNL